MRRSFISFVIFCALRFHCATTWRCSSTSSYASASFFSSCFFSPTSCSRSCSCCVCSRFLVNSSSRATRSYRSRSAPSAGTPPRGRSAPSPVLSYSPSVLQSSKSQFSSDLAHSSSISIFSDDSCRWRYFDSYSFTSFSSRNRSDVSAASRSVIRFDDECSSVSSENEERELDRETTLERRAGDDDCSRSSCSPRAIMFDTLRDRTVPPSPLTSPIVPRTPVRPRLRQSCITWSVRRRKSCILLLRYCEAERASERLLPNRGSVAPAGRSTAISCGIVAKDTASVPSVAAFGFFLMIFFITLRTFTTGRLDDADDVDDGTVAVDVSTLVVTSPSPTSLTSIVVVDLLLVESPFADRLLEEADRSGVFSRRTASPSMRRSEGDFSFGIPSSTVPRTGEALAALIGVELFSVRSGDTERLDFRGSN
uniref:REJ domain-containing protein n=1 Tax=Anopheles coluzzii TaxID=1518534 RepID=A0A8W7P157_ANOCL